MSAAEESRARIPAEAVRHSNAPVLVRARPVHGPGHEIAVVPILDGDQRVAGFEVRCGCGSHVFVECVDDLAAVAPIEKEQP